MRYLVIPCFNEEFRLSLTEIAKCLQVLECELVLVDDGSTDNTLQIINQLSAENPDHIHAISLEHNCGKAEAVRTGFAYAFSHGATIVGFCDADFSVDADDLLRLYEMLERSKQLDAVIGSRLALAGSTIERSLIRHLAGRIFATLVTFTLGQKIYDTQCGAKVFRRNQRVIESFADPFISRWAFDVEVIGRINSRKRSPQVGSTIIEVPLLRWIAQPGSKLTMSQQLRTVFELFKIRRSLKRLSRQ